jgi:pimeloyl-ACP methyl ester carboxylesterase
MIQGASDYCDAPKESEDQEKFFSGGYQRLLLDGVGHFPHREAPERVADAAAHFFENHVSR